MKLHIAAVLIATTTVAYADTQELSEDVRELTSDNYRAATVGKLMSFKLGAKCWAKLTRDSRATNLIQMSTRYIVDFAKHVTGDDWSTLEGSGTTEKAKNRERVEATIEAFKKSFSYSISVDGDDCDDDHDPLWLQYHTHALQYFSENPPPAKRGTIKIEVNSKVKKFTASVDKTGTVFKFVGPKEVAPDKWQDQMRTAFVKAAKKK
ncbi:MAG TPA: hypothetical protein VIV11_32090 [Kofleriaceae bacterium]